MKKIRLAVLFGGCSSEYEVSLHSAASVIKHLNARRIEPILIGITREGEWFRYRGEVSWIENDSWWQDQRGCVPVVVSPGRAAHELLELGGDGVQRIAIDAVFPILHGKNGEDGTVQGLFELAGIPIIGCDILSSALCMDKERAHHLIEAAGIRVPQSISFPEEPTEEQLDSAAKNLPLPVFVKPVRAGSSIGIRKVIKREELMEAVKEAFQHDSRVLVEENIEGFEVGCAILGKHELTLGAVDEIELLDGFFDYGEKYNLFTSQIHMPARIDEVTACRIKETAKAIYKILGCSGFARVDLFLTKQNEIVFNEVNTIPGFTDHSRFPNMMRGIGLDFPKLLEKLIEEGLRG